jgi:hypothetical protein
VCRLIHQSVHDVFKNCWGIAVVTQFKTLALVTVDIYKDSCYLKLFEMKLTPKQKWVFVFPGRLPVNELAQYLLENIIFDFEGEVTAESVRAFLRQDEKSGSKELMQKVIEDKGIDELLLTLADCLTANLSTGITPDVIKEHLASYAES